MSKSEKIPVSVPCPWCGDTMWEKLRGDTFLYKCECCNSESVPQRNEYLAYYMATLRPKQSMEDQQ